MYGVVLLFAVMVMVNMMRIQLTYQISSSPDSEGDEMFDAINIELVKIKALRGNIYADDIENSALAISVPIYEVRMDLVAVSKEVFRQELDSLAYCLSKLFKDKSKSQYADLLSRAKKDKKRYFLIKKGVSYGQLKKVKEFPILRKGKYKGGLIVLKQNRRANPFDILANRTVGYLSETDTVVGLEGAYNRYLKGTDGSQYMKKVAGGIYIPLTDEYLV